MILNRSKGTETIIVAISQFRGEIILSFEAVIKTDMIAFLFLRNEPESKVFWLDGVHLIQGLDGIE
jgi:hypothetical protein